MKDLAFVHSDVLKYEIVVCHNRYEFGIQGEGCLIYVINKGFAMPCNHRFIVDLYPQYPLEHLFIGTFNPEWDNPNGNNANWFYGRRTNSFWNILPPVFDHEPLGTKQNRDNPIAWKEYCRVHGIGLTDIIQSIDDADPDIHFDRVMGFQDDALEAFKYIKFTDIETLIERNKGTLRGVYLTRYTHTLSPGSVFLKRWNQIASFCDQLNIRHGCLVTPSNGYRISVGRKIEMWRDLIVVKVCV